MFVANFRRMRGGHNGQSRAGVGTDFGGGVISRSGAKGMISQAVGTAVLTFGFVLFREIAMYFLDRIGGAEATGIPFAGQQPASQAPRPSLWQAPSPAQEQRSGGIDLSEFR